jgi:hypothetical protein
MAAARPEHLRRDAPAAGRPAAAVLPGLASELRGLADRLDALEPGHVIGELARLTFAVSQAATPAPAPAAPAADPFTLLTDEAVGEVLGMSVRTVVLLRQRGLLPGVAVGDKYVRTRRRDLERFVDNLPTALYSRKYANHPHAGPPAEPDAGSDDAAPAAPSRLDPGRARRGARRHQ